MTNEDKPPLRLMFLIAVLFGLLILLMCCLIARASEKVEEEHFNNLQITDGSLIANSPPFLIEESIYASLIDCLIFHESTGNPNAYNPADPITPSYGILQFKETTFQEFCVERYKYPNDIWNAEIQKLCCENMIADGYLYHWSTRGYCY
jgi:hypothetical protein